MKVNLRKCPVCTENYGSFTTALGAKHGILCRCDKLAGLAEGLVYIVGIAFCSLVLVQTEKNLHMMKKVIDLLNTIW
jgi:hypothetical protein